MLQCRVRCGSQAPGNIGSNISCLQLLIFNPELSVQPRHSRRRSACTSKNAKMIAQGARWHSTDNWSRATPALRGIPPSSEPNGSGGEQKNGESKILIYQTVVGSDADDKLSVWKNTAGAKEDNCWGVGNLATDGAIARLRHPIPTRLGTSRSRYLSQEERLMRKVEIHAVSLQGPLPTIPNVPSGASAEAGNPKPRHHARHNNLISALTHHPSWRDQRLKVHA